MLPFPSANSDSAGFLLDAFQFGTSTDLAGTSGSEALTGDETEGSFSSLFLGAQASEDSTSPTGASSFFGTALSSLSLHAAGPIESEAATEGELTEELTEDTQSTDSSPALVAWLVPPPQQPAIQPFNLPAAGNSEVPAGQLTAATAQPVPTAPAAPTTNTPVIAPVEHRIDATLTPKDLPLAITEDAPVKEGPIEAAPIKSPKADVYTEQHPMEAETSKLSARTIEVTSAPRAAESGKAPTETKAEPAPAAAQSQAESNSKPQSESQSQPQQQPGSDSKEADRRAIAPKAAERSSPAKETRIETKATAESGESIVPGAEATQSAVAGHTVSNPRVTELSIARDGSRLQTSAPAPAPVSAAAADFSPEAKPANAPKALEIELGETAANRVTVRFVERAGQVEMSVRTPNPALSEQVRDQMPDLAQRLDEQGWRIEGAKSSAPMTLSAPSSAFESSSHSDSPRQSFDGQSASHSGSGPQGRQDQQQSSRQRSWQNWVDELEGSLDGPTQGARK